MSALVVRTAIKVNSKNTNYSLLESISYRAISKLDIRGIEINSESKKLRLFFKEINKLQDNF